MSERAGWIKLHRSLLDHPRFRDGAWLRVWTYLLLNATHTEYRVIFAGKEVVLRPGQLITSRNSIVDFCGVERSKVERILKTLKTEQQIEQLASNTSRLITILNWNEYQKVEQQNEHQVSNDRAASEQQVSTNKNGKKEKNVKEGGEASPPRTRFTPPTLDQAEAAAVENGMPKDEGENFINHHQSKDWKIGKSPMKDWRAAMRTWKRNYLRFKSPETTNRTSQLQEGQSW